LVSQFEYLVAFSSAAGSDLSDVQTTSNFALFDPPPVKMRGGVGEISIPIIEVLPTTEPPKYI